MDFPDLSVDFPVFLAFFIDFANTINKQDRLHLDYKKSKDLESPYQSRDLSTK